MTVAENRARGKRQALERGGDVLCPMTVACLRARVTMEALRRGQKVLIPMAVAQNGTPGRDVGPS